MKSYFTINPFTGEKLASYSLYSTKQLSHIIEKAQTEYLSWRNFEIKERVKLVYTLADNLENKKEQLAKLITSEMGKPLEESVAEIEKCILLCDFYAKNADDLLADELIDTEADESFISYDPLGIVLAVMPWNYPFWQVMRFAIPTLLAGNTAILKHASNVSGCSLKIQELFEESKFPKGCFNSILCDHKQLEKIIADNRIKAVTLTGSEKAGRSIAATAGKNLKKTVLELGGSNACIIFEDADIKNHIKTIVYARMQNNGQSCIAAKRFIVLEGIYESFLTQFTRAAENLKVGDPMEKGVSITVLAKPDLAKNLKSQVEKSINMGAKVLLGNSSKDAYFAPTILTNVKPGMPVFDEETFGPVAAIVKVSTENEALELAALSNYGLGTMLFTRDTERALKLTSKIEDGAYFINELVKSDPRLPFGGTKNSGYGRELSREGILEFVNKKTVYLKK